MEKHGTIHTSCYDPPGGSENRDGYVRVMNTLDDHQTLIMRHRLHWRLASGEAIPEGFEIDHLCKNRRCCNVRHLAIIGRSAHKTQTNLERYAQHRRTGLEMLDNGYTKKAVAAMLDRTVHTVNRWIRDREELV